MIAIIDVRGFSKGTLSECIQIRQPSNTVNIDEEKYDKTRIAATAFVIPGESPAQRRDETSSVDAYTAGGYTTCVITVASVALPRVRHYTKACAQDLTMPSPLTCTRDSVIASSCTFVPEVKMDLFGRIT